MSAEQAKLEALEALNKELEEKAILLDHDDSFNSTKILQDYKTSTQDEVEDLELFINERRAMNETLEKQYQQFHFFIYLIICDNFFS